MLDALYTQCQHTLNWDSWFCDSWYWRCCLSDRYQDFLFPVRCLIQPFLDCLLALAIPCSVVKQILSYYYTLQYYINFSGFFFKCPYSIYSRMNIEFCDVWDVIYHISYHMAMTMLQQYIYIYCVMVWLPYNLILESMWNSELFYNLCCCYGRCLVACMTWTHEKTMF